MKKKRSISFRVRVGLLETLIGWWKKFSNRLLTLSGLSRRLSLLFLTLFLVTLLLTFSPKVPSVATTAPVVNSITQAQSNPEQLVQQGKQLYDSGQYAAAVTIWQQATEAYRTKGDVLNQAMALSNLSLTYQQLGQLQEASQAITASLHLLGFNPQTPKTQQNSDAYKKILAPSLDIQGRWQWAIGQPEQAITTWRKAFEIYAQVGDEVGKTQNLINQAQALQSLGQYLQAQKILEPLKQTLLSTTNSLLKVRGLRSLGNVYRQIGELKNSQEVLQQSLAIVEGLQQPQAISAVQLDLGNTERALGNKAKVIGKKEEADKHFNCALEYYQKSATTQALQLQAQLNQLNLLLDNERWEEAQALLPKIRHSMADFPSSRAAVFARINLAKSLMKLGDRQEHDITEKPLPRVEDSELLEVAQLLTRGIQEAQRLQDNRAESYAYGSMGELYEDTNQLSDAKNLTEEALILTQGINASDISYRWQWQLGRLLKKQAEITQDREKFEKAIAYYTAAVETLKSVRSDLISINPDVQLSFRDNVEPLYRELVELLLQSEPKEEDIKKARDLIESLQIAELEDYLRCKLLSKRTVNIDEIFEPSNSTSAIFYPIILNNRLDIILKLPQQSLRHYTTDLSLNDFNNTITQLREKLQNIRTLKQVQLLSNRLYNWLLQPIEADLKNSNAETLVFVLDGELRNIPMAVLYDGQKYLIEKYAVALTPSLQLFDPKPLERRGLKALISGITESVQGFSRLNHVNEELEKIKSQVPSKILLNKEFTSIALEEQIKSHPFSVVHLATHGQFSSQLEETFILAWNKLINTNELSSILRTRGENLPKAIELLVLSACKTATGDKRAVLGLAGIAVRADARSTVASLWNADDKLTTTLMSRFYNELVNNPITKAEALRRAQLYLLKETGFEHPRYWAPYVLVGNWL